jgi:RHS repeat-associated protein
LKRSYIYAGAQPITFYEGDYTDPAYIYLHDRLGSVRQVIDSSGNVKNTYTYTPFGQIIEDSNDGPQATSNDFMFTGQWGACPVPRHGNSEIAQYYLRARMYDPQLMRFTSIDPVFGKLYQPLTLHKYLYCLNDPENRIDPDGEFATYAVYLFAKAVIGATIGGYSGYETSGGKVDAMLLGAVTGALSSMVGPGFSGIIQAAVLSGVNNSYSYYRRTGSIDLGVVGFFTGFAGGGITGGLMGGLGINDTGLMTFIGGTLGGDLYSRYLSIPIEPLDNLEDTLKEKERIDEEFYRENPGWR